MRLFASLPMLTSLILFFWLRGLHSQFTNVSSRSPARTLDALLQDYAYRAFVRPRTGIPYNGVVPSNLTGIEISAMRLRSGSLRSRGVATYKEFEIPVGVVVSPYVERLVLVYHNLRNWSMLYYPLPGYTYLAPVLGLLTYDASNLSASNLSELDVKALADPILIKFSDVKSVPYGSAAKCAWFDLDGILNLSNVLSGNVCQTFQQGHFSIVVESIAPSPSPEAPNEFRKKESNLWIIIGSVLGGLALFALIGFLVLWMRKYKDKKQMQQMEQAADVGETLQMTPLGNTKAPAAMMTRTQPSLENEYVL